MLFTLKLLLLLLLFQTVISSLYGKILAVNTPDVINSEIINIDVDTKIDLTSHLAKITSVVKLSNQSPDPVSMFHYALDPYIADKLSFIGAQIDSDDEGESVVLAVSDIIQVENAHKEGNYIRISLAEPLEASQSITVEIESVYANTQSPYPREIRQDDAQLVLFIANLHHFSPYVTYTEMIRIELESKNVESYTTVRPVALNENIISYGPYTNIGPYKKQKLSVHFENNSPFLTVLSLDRWVEVSHWGNIAVEEKLHVRHTGAKLLGSFSRYDFQKNPYGKSAAIKSFKTLLPRPARHAYYRDEIGNISTSHLVERIDAVEVDIRPRFPLFGGWQTRYTLGYSLPTSEYLYQLGSTHLLKMRLMDHVYGEQCVEQLTLSIVLPEGSEIMNFEPPYPVDSTTRTSHYTYLDTIGRPVIVINKRNLVSQHIQDFRLTYSFNSVLMLQEPLLIFSALFILFITIIIIVRLDFSIIEDEKTEYKLKQTALTDEIRNIFEKRLSLFKKFIDLIEKLKLSKDTKSFKNSKKGLDNEKKLLQDKIYLIESKQISGELLAKFQSFSEKDSNLKQNIEKSCNLVEKFVSTKSGKEQFVSQETHLIKEREEMIGQMKSALNNL